MILEQHRGQKLFDEVIKDFKEIKKVIKKKRDLVRKNNKNKNFDEIVWCKFKHLSKTGNLWNITTGLLGDINKPKAIDNYYVVTNSGPGGSKLYIIYRGNKTAKKNLGLDGGGYLITVTGHVLTRMKSRNESFKNLTNEELVESIFKSEEEGIYYLFDWTKYAEKTLVPTSIEDYKDIKYRIKKKEIPQNPIIMKTSAGLFLGYVTEDSAEVRLSTYITKAFTDEEEELIGCFLEPVWECYNAKDYDQDYIKLTYDKLMSYMKDKDDRTVCRLGI